MDREHDHDLRTSDLLSKQTDLLAKLSAKKDIRQSLYRETLVETAMTTAYLCDGFESVFSISFYLLSFCALSY